MYSLLHRAKSMSYMALKQVPIVIGLNLDYILIRKNYLDVTKILKIKIYYPREKM